MTPKVKLSKYNVNVLHIYAVKFIFKSVKSSKRDMHEDYAQWTAK